MAKRKRFAKTDLRIPQIEHSRDAAGAVVIDAEVFPPLGKTIVRFSRNAVRRKSADFARWYGTGFDPITYACQRQIERFLAGQDGDLEISTIASYYYTGLYAFFVYCKLRVAALNRELTLVDIDRGFIDDYLSHLKGTGLSSVTQKSLYSNTKSVLHALGRRGLINLIDAGDAATFPRNPFPNINRKRKGEKALTKRERQAFTVALRQAVMPLWIQGAPVTCELLLYALLMVALHTGRNTTPLLEMSVDCLRAHPKDDTVFLVLWKRRGHNTSKIALRTETKEERERSSMPIVRTNIERLIRRVMELTAPLRLEASDELKSHLWLYRSRRGRLSQVTALAPNSFIRATKKLVADYGLTDSDGAPLRINVSRLRKTFANRIFELSDGDLATTANALGNTTQVADRNYLASGADAPREWRFMGEMLVQELLSHTIGATYQVTPMGRCSDQLNGQYAPKREGATCFNFINCLRCKHYAVTADDLHRLFSFYFRVLAERSKMDKRRWARQYAQIPRLIDNYIVAEGLRRRSFKPSEVEAARERARSAPHPFWSVDMVNSLELFA